MEQGPSTSNVADELANDLLLTPPAKMSRQDPDPNRTAVQPQSSSNPVGLSDSPRTDVQLQDTSFGAGALAANQPEPQPWAPTSSSFSTFRAPERPASPQPGPSRQSLMPSPPPLVNAPSNPNRGPSMHPVMPPSSGQEAANPYLNLHPWAHLVVPMPMPTAANNDTVTSELPDHVYRHLPESGYLGIRYVRTLFPRRFLGTISATNRLPVIELMRINHAIDFRLHAETVIRQMERGAYIDVDNPLPVTPHGEVPSILYPETIKGFFPVLYQEAWPTALYKRSLPQLLLWTHSTTTEALKSHPAVSHRTLWVRPLPGLMAIDSTPTPPTDVHPLISCDVLLMPLG
ncbi:hypothetical protein Y032_0051g2078 [Ancylostoma ceylanicum]|uniref:Uncharacterized protein n=1 Tax=Ancylostoma ceylanicum TaxID=53326 RepID=A0A016U8N2_9BILA|nr:hypothetical protein Y032_0051g2078 [Ancylostoma ceylanicum]